MFLNIAVSSDSRPSMSIDFEIICAHLNNHLQEKSFISRIVYDYLILAPIEKREVPSIKCKGRYWLDLQKCLKHSMKSSGFNGIGRISAKKFSGGEIAEALQSEASFTIATDKKPIVATYGCDSCVALGGYDATNKLAFIVHFSNAKEIRGSSGLIFFNLLKLIKIKIKNPIQLHLRGGVEGRSDEIIKAIKVWMNLREDLPMKIASEDILNEREVNGKSLSIDSRNGQVSEYDPSANPEAREITDLDHLQLMANSCEPKITLAYCPE